MQRHAQTIVREVELLAAELSDYASGLVGVVRLWANTSEAATAQPAP